MAWIAARGTGTYADEVDKLVGQIKGNVVGSLIVSAIYRTSRDVLIRSLADYKGSGAKQCRGIADADDPAGAAPKGAGRSGAVGLREKLYYGHRDNPDTDDDERYNTSTKTVGTGVGSKATVYFTPSEWGSGGCYSGGSGALPDEVLLHELVHALRITQGVRNAIPTRNTNYDNDEEFLAIVVTNVYISSKNPSRPLVASHHDYSHLWKPLNTSKGFVDDRDNYDLLDYYLNDATWALLRDLANLKAVKFNPFHEFVNRPKPKGGRKP